MDNSTARIIGGCFIALLSALGDDIAKAATDCLHSWANNPDFRPEDRRIYGCIADAASGTLTNYAPNSAASLG
jgi:hypothetical protein